MMTSSFHIHISYYIGANGRKKRLVGTTEWKEVEVQETEHSNFEGKKELTQDAMEKIQYIVSENGKSAFPWMVEN